MKSLKNLALISGAALLLWGPAFLYFSAFPPQVAFAERGANAPGQGKTLTRDSSSTNIPTTYTTNASMGTSITGKNHMKVINATAVDIAVSNSTATTNCVGSVDNDIIPANSYSVMDNIFVNTVVCVRSLGSAISSGKVHIVLW